MGFQVHLVIVKIYGLFQWGYNYIYLFFSDGSNSLCSALSAPMLKICLCWKLEKVKCFLKRNGLKIKKDISDSHSYKVCNFISIRLDHYKLYESIFSLCKIFRVQTSFTALLLKVEKKGFPSIINKINEDMNRLKIIISKSL